MGATNVQCSIYLRDWKPNIVVRQLRSPTELIVQPKVWKGTRIRGRNSIFYQSNVRAPDGDKKTFKYKKLLITLLHNYDLLSKPKYDELFRSF